MQAWTSKQCGEAVRSHLLHTYPIERHVTWTTIRCYWPIGFVELSSVNIGYTFEYGTMA